MSYLPVDLARFSRSTYTFGAFATRVQLARDSPTTQTTASFTVPAVQGDVTISVGSSSSFFGLDYVVVGSRLSLLRAPVHSNTGAGSFTFTGYYPGSLPAGTVVDPAGHTVISLSSGNRTTTTTTGWVLPNWQQSTDTVSVGVADRSKIDSGGIVMVTNYAGLFQVIAAPTPTSLTLRLIRAGDLLAGATCVQEMTYTYTGTPVSQGYPLTHIENVPYRAFFPADAFAVAVVQGASSSINTAAISVGWSPGNAPGRARFGNFMQARAVQASSVLTVGTMVPLPSNINQADNDRIAIPFGTTLMACVTTRSGNYPVNDNQIDLLVRGYYSEG